jgi:predicted ester cyclase
MLARSSAPHRTPARDVGPAGSRRPARVAAVDRAAFYRAYLSRCNKHRFDELVEFVAGDVVVDGEPRGLAGYAAALRAVVDGFPDYHWDLRQLLVDGDRLAAHLHDTGTHRGEYLGVPGTGRRVTAEEYAFYRLRDGRIAEVWGTADNLALLRQMRTPPA